MFDRARDARDGMETARRRYTTATVRQRLHQCAFRERVLAAYRQQCAFCRFRHAELLDAAHMLPDTDEGEPVVANGLALCKLHHAAFDRYFLGVRPDYIVQVRDDLLGETDGPTLVHGIQALHGNAHRRAQETDAAAGSTLPGDPLRNLPARVNAAPFVRRRSSGARCPPAFVTPERAA